jgi:hypothetical protein
MDYWSFGVAEIPPIQKSINSTLHLLDREEMEK